MGLGQHTFQQHLSRGDDFCALEERVLFDGAAAATALDTAQDDPGTEAAAEPTAAPPDPVPPAPQPQTGDALTRAAAAMPSAQSDAVFFVDAGLVPGADLVSAIPEAAELVILEADRDGVEQIASVLQGRSGLAAIHILSHGAAGDMQLGSARLDAGSICGTYAETLARIGAALAKDGDLLIYGCDFGQDHSALAALATATGADVAASDDTTGAAGRGGDWNLEVSSGTIGASAIAPLGFDGVLALPEVTVPATAASVAEDSDLILAGVAVGDPDEADQDDLAVTLSVATGTLTLAQTTGLTVTGDGSGALALSGAQDDLNAALSGMIYRPDDDFNGADTLIVTVDDGDAISSDSLRIDISAVNDAPSLSPGSPSVDEGASVTLTVAHFGLSDPDLDATLNPNPQLPKQLLFQLDGATLPASGTIYLDAAPLVAASSFSLQDILDGRLSYRHDNSDVSPGDTDRFAVTVNDGGGSGDIGPVTITVALQPVNQAPSISGGAAVFEGQGSEEEFGNPGTITQSVDVGAGLRITDRDDALADMQIALSNIDTAGDGTLFWDINGDGCSRRARRSAAASALPPASLRRGGCALPITARRWTPIPRGSTSR